MDRPPGWRRFLRVKERDVESEIDDELRFHLDMRTEEQVRQGVPEPDARRAALERFGNVESVHDALGSIGRERVRGERRREAALDLGQDIAYAVRILLRKPLTAIIIVLCLALGIGSATTVFSVGDALLLRPLPYPNGSRLVQVGTTRGADKRITVASFEDYADWRDRQRTFDALGAYQRQSFTIVTDEAVRIFGGARMTSSVFQALGIRPLRGRLFTTADDVPSAPLVAIVTASFANGMLGGVDKAVGSMLQIGERQVEVVGILESAAAFPEGVQTFTNMPRAVVPQNRGSRSLELIGALKPGVSVDAAQRDLAAIYRQVARENPGLDSTVSAGVRPLRERYVGGARSAFAAIAGAAALLLVIACANVASLQLARGSARAREIAVRSALGATRGRVLRLLLTESLILAVVGGAAGIAVAMVSTQVVSLSIPTQFERWMTPELDVRVLLATLAISTLTGITFGLAPALRLSRIAPARSLHDGGRGGVDLSRVKLQRTFVAVQMALSVVLLVGAAMAAMSFSRLTRQDPGFTASGATLFRLAMRGERYDDPDRRIQLVASLEEQLRAVPGVELVAAGSHVPIADCCSKFGLNVEGEVRGTSNEHMVTGNVVTPDYFKALGIRFIAGRTFTDADRRSAPRVVIINETFARQFFPGREALGRKVFEGDREKTVIGVVRDVKQTTLMDAPEPQFYQAQSQAAWDGLTFVVRVRDGIETGPVIAEARRILRGIDPLTPLYRTSSMEQVLDDALTSQRMFRTLLQGFALIALILAAAGMYGITSYYVAQRIPELGIRLALGAQPGSLMRLVLRQGVVLALIGAFAGVNAAVGAASVLSNMLYGVAANEPMVYAIAIGLLSLTTLVACIGPAVRATSVEPLTALRSE
jgi:predicted permease